MEQTQLEQDILQKAEELFLEKGFASTSTTDIARAVGCTQALVHYYYRTKEKLFQQIFLGKLELLLSYVSRAQYDGDIFGCIETIVNQYFNLLSANRKLPFFVLQELVLNPERRNFIRTQLIDNPSRQSIYAAFDTIIQNEVKKGTIRPIETFDLLLNIVSLVVTNFVMLPIYEDCLQKDEAAVSLFLEQRRQEILTTIFSRLQP